MKLKFPKLKPLSLNQRLVTFIIFIFFAISVHPGILKLKNTSPLPKNIPPLVPTSVVATPTPSEHYGWMGEIPYEVKKILYIRGSSIYMKKIDGKNFSPEEELATAAKPIDIYAYESHKYLIYSYLLGAPPSDNSNNSDMRGNSDTVVIKDLSTGISKQVYTANPKKDGYIASLSISENGTFFISTDLNRLFTYDWGSNSLQDITPKEDRNRQEVNFCAGYSLIDQSPDRKHLILAGRCYEGGSFSLYDIETGKLSDLGFAYVEGRSISKFMGDGAFLAYTYNENGIIKAGKYNFDDKLVQELPVPTKSSEPVTGLNLMSHDTDVRNGASYHNEIFIALEKDKNIPFPQRLSDAIENNRYLGKDVENIRFYK